MKFNVNLHPEDYPISKLTSLEPWAELLAESDAQLQRFAHQHRLRQARLVAGALVLLVLGSGMLYWLFS